MIVESSFTPGGEFHLAFKQPVFGALKLVGQDLIVHGHPRQITGDRLAVAATLLKGHALGRSLDVRRPVSSNVAGAINKFLDTSFLNVKNVENSPPTNNPGGLELVLLPDGTSLSKSEDEYGRKRMLFVDLPVDKNAGRIFRFDSIQVASNAHLFATRANYQKPVPSLWAKLALPVIFASDLSVSRISVARSVTEGVSKSEFIRLSNLLHSIEISLVIEGS